MEGEGREEITFTIPMSFGLSSEEINRENWKEMKENARHFPRVVFSPFR